jgi:hypothetical protein
MEYRTGVERGGQIGAPRGRRGRSLPVRAPVLPGAFTGTAARRGWQYPS